MNLFVPSVTRLSVVQKKKRKCEAAAGKLEGSRSRQGPRWTGKLDPHALPCSRQVWSRCVPTDKGTHIRSNHPNNVPRNVDDPVGAERHLNSKLAPDDERSVRKGGEIECSAQSRDSDGSCADRNRCATQKTPRVTPGETESFQPKGI